MDSYRMLRPIWAFWDLADVWYYEHEFTILYGIWYVLLAVLILTIYSDWRGGRGGTAG